MRQSGIMISILYTILLACAPFEIRAADVRGWQKYIDFLGRDGGYNPKPEAWTGRWFPDKPTPAPSQPNSDVVFSENNMHGKKQTDIENQWKGKWFPDKPSSDNQRGYQIKSPNGGESPDYLSLDDWRDEDLTKKHSEHVLEMITMDNELCDDGKHNLTRDIPNDESNFICASVKRYIEPNYELPPILTKNEIPLAFVPSHRCMNESITYTFPLPTFGPHRPVWARWGEYEYLPPQRWIHNLEHGGIVMLYHPCAHRFLVQQLRNLVRKCLYKHVITPYKLSLDRPLALVAWGWSLRMAEVDLQEAKKFIQDHANRAPEMIDTDGKYDLYLKHPSSDFSQLGEGICSKV